MSEKYTIKEIHFQDNPDSTFFILDNMSIEHGSFNSKEKAELVCRLLNEEEKRKSLPKISKGTKKVIINYLKNDCCDWWHDERTKTIKVIESLEAE